MVLDLGLPGMDGYDVTRSIRRHSAIPIIMLTARTEETDRFVGLEFGADDYVVKPFSPRELVARVKAVLRRTNGETATETIRARDLVIDLPHRRVERNGTRIELTALRIRAAEDSGRQPRSGVHQGPAPRCHAGRCFRILRAVDRRPHQEPAQELEPDPHTPVYVLTVYGVGYKFADA